MFRDDALVDSGRFRPFVIAILFGTLAACSPSGAIDAGSDAAIVNVVDAVTPDAASPGSLAVCDPFASPTTCVAGEVCGVIDHDDGRSETRCVRVGQPVPDQGTCHPFALPAGSANGGGTASDCANGVKCVRTAISATRTRFICATLCTESHPHCGTDQFCFLTGYASTTLGQLGACAVGSSAITCDPVRGDGCEGSTCIAVAGLSATPVATQCELNGPPSAENQPCSDGLCAAGNVCIPDASGTMDGGVARSFCRRLCRPGGAGADAGDGPGCPSETPNCVPVGTSGEYARIGVCR